MFKDWCPLCGRRFQAETAKELCDQIVKHVEDGSCESNFKPLEEALKDDSYERRE